MTAKDLTVIIPAYNEEKSLKEIIELVKKHIDCAILVVDDCSKDNSLKILRNLQKKNRNLKAISKKKNQGYGAALKTGFFSAKTKYLAFLDADLTYHPKYIPILLNEVKKNNLDCAWCNRFGGKSNRMPLERKIGNKIIALIFLAVTGRYIPDATCGERVFNKESLMRLNPETLPDNLDMISALTKRIVARKLKYKIIPCDYAKREGSSKLNIIRDFMNMVRNALFEK